MTRKYAASGFKERRLGGNRFRVIGEGVAGLQERVTVVHLKQPPDSADAPVRHKKTDEFVYVVKGSVTAVVAGRRIPLAKGDVLHVKARAPHYFRSGPRGVEVMCFFLPAMDLKAPDIHAVAGREKGSRRRID